MNNRIQALVEQIARLEDELQDELATRQEQLSYQLRGTRVKFERSILELHRKLRVPVGAWLRHAKLRNALSAPFIYSMILPIALTDLCITLYQHICFRLYQIARVDRSRYIVVDRHQLQYLNGIEKLNCVYCGYGNGVFAYAREVVSQTEQYWCPIKHARKVAGVHSRYQQFLEFGDAEGYETQRHEYRQRLRDGDEGPESDEPRASDRSDP